MRTAVRVGVVVALLLQAGLTVLVVAGWVGYDNVSGGECSWGGTCTDNGQLWALLVGLLVLPAIEVAVGLLTSRIPMVIMLGCAYAAVVYAQGFLINALASAGGGPDATQASAYLHVSTGVIAAELAAMLLAFLAFLALRRLRRPAQQ